MQVQIHPEFKFYGSATMGVCWLCGSSRRPGDVVVDLCRDITTEELTSGAAQVCSSCVRHMGHQIGMVDSDEVKKHEEARLAYAAKSKHLDTVTAKLEAALKAIGK